MLCPKILVPVLLVCASAGFVGAAAPGALLELGEVESTAMKDLDQQYRDRVKAELPGRSDIVKSLGTMAAFQQLIQEHLGSRVPSRRLRYASVDAQGAERGYSGRVLLPSRKPGAGPMEVPLVIYQHATETRRLAVPYFNRGDETMLGAMAAELFGFAVAMPDGDGMGADPSPRMHAYCSSPTSAACVIDLIRAALNGVVDGRRLFDDANYVWDGEIFIVGYSEGGYIALSALKELSTNPALGDIQLTGAACMGGPFDLADATRALLTDPRTPYDRPYIPGYFVAAWKDLYPETVKFNEAIHPSLLKQDASGNAARWLNGDLGGDEITLRIQARLTGNKHKAVPARAILNEAWVRANIEDGSSRLNRLLQDNTLVGSWKPKVPVLLAHDPHDRTVAFTGTQAIHDQWQRLGAKPQGILKLAIGSRGTGHVGGALVAIPSAFVWIAAGMPASVQDLAREKLRRAMVEHAPPVLEANADALGDALGLREANANRALLPLSRIDFKAPAGTRPYTLGYADRLFKIGKVKLYAIEPEPVFARQAPSPGLGGYTRLVKELKELGDSVQLQPNVPYCMAVYPAMGGVALTLKFTSGSQVYTANIKQPKNKILGRNVRTHFSISSNFKRLVQTDHYDRAETGRTFITLGP